MKIKPQPRRLVCGSKRNKANSRANCHLEKNRIMNNNNNNNRISIRNLFYEKNLPIVSGLLKVLTHIGSYNRHKAL